MLLAIDLEADCSAANVDEEVCKLANGNGLFTLDESKWEGGGLDDKVTVSGECMEEGLLELGIDLEEASSLGNVGPVLEEVIVLDDGSRGMADELEGEFWVVEGEEVLREENYVVGINVVGYHVLVRGMEDAWRG